MQIDYDVQFELSAYDSTAQFAAEVLNHKFANPLFSSRVASYIDNPPTSIIENSNSVSPSPST